MITKDEIKDALNDAKGNVALAAKKVGCSRQYLHARIKKSKDLQETRDEARATGLEWAESKLFDLIEGKPIYNEYTRQWRYERLPDLRAIMFYLSTQHGWTAPKPELDRQTMNTLKRLVKDIQKAG